MRGRFGRKGALLGAAALILTAAACGGGGGAGSAPAASNGDGSPAKTPIRIGVSVALTGDFSGDGKAILDGYQLWARDVNARGGLLGRPVQLVIKDDASQTQQELTNYQTLIGTEHVDLVFGPFSSLLTIPAESVAKRYGYLLLGPAGGGPKVFEQKYVGYAFVQPAAVVDSLVSFADLLKSLPPAERPKTVAYATSNDPFTEPQLVRLKPLLTAMGVQQVYWTVFPDETPDLQAEALAVVKSKADVVVLGTTSVPQVQAFIQAFIQQKYNPKVILATGGPDQGANFANAVGVQNTEGIMTALGWTPTADTYQNQEFVQEYVAKYGGKPSDIPADAAQAYSVGQVLEQLVGIAHSLKNADLIKALHSGHVIQTLQGPMTWDDVGVPHGTGNNLIQWQGGATKIVWPKADAQASFEYPKPAWP
ncbi:MAG: amino acid ABC transporter substrate-binding protein [Firmicutes bacterium]|nr:amino acid ABC transporter substrate-binding protein [Bacillota bacterium]